MIERDPRYFEAGQRRIAQTLPYLDAFAGAAFDAKAPRVGMKTLLSAGLLTLGETLYFKKNAKATSTIQSPLQSNGRISIHETEYDIHQGAGVAQNKNARLNGWSFWYVKRNDTLCLLDDLRQQYRIDKLGFTPLDKRLLNYKTNPLTYAEVDRILCATSP